MTTLELSKITTEQKIDLIFSKLFTDSKDLEESFFWNCLSSQELLECENILAEKMSPLESLL